MTAAPRPALSDFLPDELVAACSERGIDVDEALARRLLSAVLKRGEPDLTKVPGLSHAKRALLEEAFVEPRVEVVARHVSPSDGFTKYLFRLEDGAEVEAVRIPIPCEPPDTPEGRALKAKIGGEWMGTRRRYIVCVSSQVGCALGCAFCATATLGFKRNLRSSEILAQVLAVRAEADRPIGGIVFMGMGEPFLNYDHVVRSARLLSHPAGVGIAARDITISTAGIVPAIRRYTAEKHRFRLAISLSSARPERRRVLMPIEKKYKSAELVQAMREYSDSARDRVSVAYVLLGGPEGNCTEEDAIALGALLRDVPIRLDLIEVNGTVGGYSPPSVEELSSFRDALARELPQPVARRYSGGRDVDAACGMLAAKRPEESLRLE